jgi:putative peptide maturation dehydrogenase
MVQGDLEVRRIPRLLAISILRGTEFAISEEDFELLSKVPSDQWTNLADRSREEQERVARLAELGLVLSTEADPLLAELRRKDERLAAGPWNIYAALFHSLTTWRDVDLRGRFGDPEELLLQADEAVAAFVDRHGRPPPHFHRVDRAGPAVELPLAGRDGDVFAALARRKTTRAFDPAAALTLEELAIVCYEVFGCHGLVAIGEDVTALKRTSPSGGSLHPIEAYVLARNVDGLDPGLYHYRAEDHALEPLESLTAEEAEDLAAEFVCGQTYFASAGALFVLVARFERIFWKYRKHQRAYGVLLLDAGHLSQTLYLVCAELGLGAYVTAAINGANIGERLGLDEFAEGAVAVCGCGKRAREPSGLEPEFVPYVPRPAPE